MHKTWKKCIEMSGPKNAPAHKAPVALWLRGAEISMHETGGKCIEMSGPENGTPLTGLLWHFGCKTLKSQCTKRAESASKCPVLEDGTPLKHDMPQKPWKLGTHVLTAAVGAVPHFMRRD